MKKEMKKAIQHPIGEWGKLAAEAADRVGEKDTAVWLREYRYFYAAKAGIYNDIPVVPSSELMEYLSSLDEKAMQLHANQKERGK